MEQDFIQQIDECNKKLEEEMKSWELLQMDPGQIGFNAFIQDAHHWALVDLLMEKGVFTDPEYTLAFKKRLLKNLEKSRLHWAPKVMEDRKRASKIATPQKGIILPNGNMKKL